MRPGWLASEKRKTKMKTLVSYKSRKNQKFVNVAHNTRGDGPKSRAAVDVVNRMIAQGLVRAIQHDDGSRTVWQTRLSKAAFDRMAVDA